MTFGKMIFAVFLAATSLSMVTSRPKRGQEECDFFAVPINCKEFCTCGVYFQEIDPELPAPRPNLYSVCISACNNCDTLDLKPKDGFVNPVCNCKILKLFIDTLPEEDLLPDRPEFNLGECLKDEFYHFLFFPPLPTFPPEEN